MKTSNELYYVYSELIRDAKSSIRELIEKRPKKKISFSNACPEILIEGWDCVEKVSIEKISLDDGFIKVYSDGEELKGDMIHSSEWLYILECVECGLEE